MMQAVAKIELGIWGGCLGFLFFPCRLCYYDNWERLLSVSWENMKYNMQNQP